MILYSYGMNSKKWLLVRCIGMHEITRTSWISMQSSNHWLGFLCHWIEIFFILIFFNNHRNGQMNKNKDLHWKLYCRKDKSLGMVIRKYILYIFNVTFMIPGFLLCILLKTTVLATDPIWLVNLIIRHIFLYNFLIREIL